MPNETDGIIKRFEQRTIRSLWDEERQEWYFSIVDVVGALTDSPDYQTGRKYWNKLKQRLHEEGSEGRVAESNFCGTPFLQTNQEKNGNIASKSKHPKPKEV